MADRVAFLVAFPSISKFLFICQIGSTASLFIFYSVQIDSFRIMLAEGNFGGLKTTIKFVVELKWLIIGHSVVLLKMVFLNSLFSFTSLLASTILEIFRGEELTGLQRNGKIKIDTGFFLKLVRKKNRCIKYNA